MAFAYCVAKLKLFISISATAAKPRNVRQHIMTTELLTLIGAILGAGITLISVFLNNKFQLRRDSLKYVNDYNIEKLKIESETKSNHELSILNNIENAIQLLSEIQLEISLTKSVIDSSNNLKFKDFDVNYLKENNKLAQIQAKSLIYFPQVLNKVENIVGFYNNYWGHQRILLMHYEQDRKENPGGLFEKVIQASDNTSREIVIIKNDLLELANKITNKYVA